MISRSGFTTAPPLDIHGQREQKQPEHHECKPIAESQLRVLSQEYIERSQCDEEHGDFTEGLFNAFDGSSREFHDGVRMKYVCRAEIARKCRMTTRRDQKVQWAGRKIRSISDHP